MKDDHPYDLQHFIAPHDAAGTYGRAAAELQCHGLRCDMSPSTRWR
jgi:hypothetical protein